jgi:hypothetical protein
MYFKQIEFNSIAGLAGVIHRKKKHKTYFFIINLYDSKSHIHTYK